MVIEISTWIITLFSSYEIVVGENVSQNKLCKIYLTGYCFYARVHSSICITYAKYLWKHNQFAMFLIFNPWKALWKLIAVTQNSFIVSPGLLYHLTRGDTGRLVNEIVPSNPIDSLKEYLSVSKLQTAMTMLAPESGMASNFSYISTVKKGTHFARAFCYRG